MREVHHDSARRVADQLRRRGVVGPFLEFEESTKTAKDAATAIGCDVGAIASSLVFILDDEPIIILKSGAFRVDLDEFVNLVGGESIRRATAEEVREATGQAIGGVSPIGWPGDLRVFVDRHLGWYERLWAACGTPNAVFETSLEELIELTSGQLISLHAPD